MQVSVHTYPGCSSSRICVCIQSFGSKKLPPGAPCPFSAAARHPPRASQWSHPAARGGRCEGPARRCEGRCEGAVWGAVRRYKGRCEGRAGRCERRAVWGAVRRHEGRVPRPGFRPAAQFPPERHVAARAVGTRWAQGAAPWAPLAGAAATTRQGGGSGGTLGRGAAAPAALPTEEGPERRPGPPSGAHAASPPRRRRDHAGSGRVHQLPAQEDGAVRGDPDRDPA